jgi:hypothetical protein
VAIAAIDAELASVKLVTEGNWLGRRLAKPGEGGRPEVNPIDGDENEDKTESSDEGGAREEVRSPGKDLCHP